MAAALVLAAAASALAPPRVTTFEAPMRAGTSAQSLWDNPLSLKDALAADVPVLSSGRIETEDGSAFLVDCYPRGTNGARGAAVYLRYLPSDAGDEVDASFELSLVRDGAVAATSEGCGGAAKGGAPAWRGAMTFCGTAEAVESCGRARDWGAHAWSRVEAGEEVAIVGEIAVWERRSGETSARLRGAARAVARAAAPGARRAAFRSGEVLVPVADSADGSEALEAVGLRSGGEYRIMALEVGGAPAFSCRRGEAAVATVRPAARTADARGAAWPVAVSTALPGVTWRTRFDAAAFPSRVLYDLGQNPRLGGSPARAAALVLFWLASALAPIPLVLLARTYASVYVIPSESMAPALAKGDVLLVDKVGLRRAPLPGVGDMVVFSQPPALRALVGATVAPSAQFVKRVAALPGDAPSFETRPGDGLCAAPSAALRDALAAAAEARAGAPVAPNAVFVRGDCDGVSVDSRVWGDLEARFLVGTPTYRLWPPNRTGPL